MKDGGSYEDKQFSNMIIENKGLDPEQPEKCTNSFAIFMNIEARDEMSRIYFGEFNQKSSTIRLLTQLTREQKSILKTLNINEPSTVVDIQT